MYSEIFKDYQNSTQRLKESIQKEDEKFKNAILDKVREDLNGAILNDKDTLFLVKEVIKCEVYGTTIQLTMTGCVINPSYSKWGVPYCHKHYKYNPFVISYRFKDIIDNNSFNKFITNKTKDEFMNEFHKNEKLFKCLYDQDGNFIYKYANVYVIKDSKIVAGTVLDFDKDSMQFKINIGNEFVYYPNKDIVVRKKYA